MDKTVITTHELTRQFGEIKAVDSLELSVTHGRVYGFLGPNGAGKTTTIRMLLGLIRPDIGEVQVFQKDLRKNRIKLLRRIGALVESPSYYPYLSGRENLEITRRLRGLDKKEVSDALDLVGLSSAALRKVCTYSLGMKQRLGLAQAFLGQPEILILDEPTNGLDPAGIHEIRELITRLPKERSVTIFLSSHLLNEVEQVADDVGIIHEGAMLFQGTLKELQEKKQAYLKIGTNRPSQAADILKKKGWLTDSQSESILTVPVKDETSAGEVNSLLVEAGLMIFHLSVEQSSLEDIFLDLTNSQGGR
ncbi:ATP-binding cassette domain-containing protein [Acidobacteriota bacterium]